MVAQAPTPGGRSDRPWYLHPALIVTIFVAILTAWVATFVVARIFWDTWSTRGTVGDTFGAINALSRTPSSGTSSRLPLSRS